MVCYIYTPPKQSSFLCTRMGFSSFRRQVESLYCHLSCIHQCLGPVRRNASVFVWPETQPQRRFFSSGPTSKSSSFALSNSVATSLLREYGFSDAQLSKLGKTCPSIFKSKTNKNLELKLKFLRSIGLSSADFPSLATGNYCVLNSSLVKQIIPAYNYLKNLPLPDDQIVRAVKNFPYVLMANVKSVLIPNIELLRSMRLPLSSIECCVVLYARMLCRNHEMFRTSVDQVTAMGLNPLKTVFVVAVQVVCSLSKEKWEQKLKLYRSFGLSEDEFLHAFRMLPWIMAISEKKIVNSMEIFLNKLQLAPAVIARRPGVLLYDLEKRTIPRYHVMEMLKMRGLASKRFSLSILKLKEKDFLDRFVHRYRDDFPELLDAYNSLRSPPQRRTADLSSGTS